MTKPKSPTILKAASAGLNSTQAKSIGVPRGYKFEPRERHPDEALPITFTQSEINPMPVWENARKGANDFQAVRSKGYSC